MWSHPSVLDHDLSSGMGTLDESKPKSTPTVEQKQLDQETSPTTPSSDEPKPQPAEPRTVVVGKYLVVGLSEEDEAFYRDFSKQRRRNVRTKIDLRLLPVLCLLYMFAQLDRSNIGNAKIEGLKRDTHLTDDQYNIILAVFFIPYCLLEVPSNMIVKMLARPSRYISVLVTAWGIVMTCHGFATNFGSLVGLRLMLGVTESGYYPAALFLCSQWYRPHELAGRLSLFMACAAISGITSGLLAAAIAKMDGIGGYEGWRWLFIVEGLATVVSGIATWFLLIDTPARSGSWLEKEEIRYLEIQAFIKDGGAVCAKDKPSSFKELLSFASHWRYWAFGIMFFVSQATDYGLKFSIPAMIHGMGYNKSQSQLLSTIPYIFGFISTLTISISSDLLAWRSPFISIAFISATVGFGIIYGHIHVMENHAAVIIAGMSLVTIGTFPMNPTGGGWISNNISTSSRRAVGLAMVVSIGSCGGLAGSFMFIENQAPHFSLGLKVSLAFSIMGLILCLMIATSYWYDNRLKDKEMSNDHQEYTEEQMLKMGEKSPLFRYTL